MRHDFHRFRQRDIDEDFVHDSSRRCIRWAMIVALTASLASTFVVVDLGAGAIPEDLLVRIRGGKPEHGPEERRFLFQGQCGRALTRQTLETTGSPTTIAPSRAMSVLRA